MNYIKKSFSPKISVIIPVYGVEKFIERCARSLFEQTLDDIEFLFIDDCSPDKSIDILNSVIKDFPNRKPQVKIHRMEQNSGQAAVRKWGMQNVTGEFVIHCDSDDWVDRDLYRAMYEKAVDDDADVVICDYRVSYGDKVIQQIKGCVSTDCQKAIQRQLFQRDSWSLWNKLFRRTACYKDLIYPEENMGEDMVLCMQMMFKCRSMAYVKGLYYYYYCNEFSISNLRNISIHVRNYERLKANTDLLIDIIKDKKLEHRKWIINELQYNATVTLMSLIHVDRKFRDMWMNTYPGTNLMFIFNPFVSFRERIKALLAIVGLYPLKKDRITDE